MTHTYATMHVSERTFYEIKKAMIDAGYTHAFDNQGDTLDMNGIALEIKPLTYGEKHGNAV